MCDCKFFPVIAIVHNFRDAINDRIILLCALFTLFVLLILFILLMSCLKFCTHVFLDNAA